MATAKNHRLISATLARLLAVGLLAGSAAAVAGTFTPVPAVTGSDAGSTDALAINDSGMIGGSYTTGGGSLTSGFVGTLGGSYTTFNYSAPGFTAVVTQVRGMDSAGDAVGYAADASGNLREFLRSSSGTITTLLDPSTSTPLNRIVGDINSAGTIVGNFVSGGLARGYILSPDLSTLTPVAVPGAIQTTARGINNTGLIDGFFIDGSGLAQGYIYNTTLNAFTVVDDPLAVNGTYLEGINDAGLVTGDYLDAANDYHAFIYDPTTSAFTSIDVPGSTNSQAWEINNFGQVAVTTDTGSDIWSPTPVPEPATTSLLAVGLAGVGFMKRRKAA